MDTISTAYRHQNGPDQGREIYLGILGKGLARQQQGWKGNMGYRLFGGVFMGNIVGWSLVDLIDWFRRS